MMPTYPQHRNMKAGAGGKNANNLNPPPPPQVSALDMDPSSNLGDLVSCLVPTDFYVYLTDCRLYKYNQLGATRPGCGLTGERKLGNLFCYNKIVGLF